MSKIKVGDERVISFKPELRNNMNAYKISDYELVPYSFKNGDFKVYKNLNFSIFIDDFCNANCKFCVAQLRYENRGCVYRKNKLPVNEWLDRLAYTLEVVRPLNPSISITGGEPTVSKKLIPTLKMIDELGFRKRVITTNGSKLFNKLDNKAIIDYLIDYNFNHLNISRHAISDTDDKRIMRFNNENDFCTAEMLKEIFAITNNSTLKHRMSCILLKDSINSVPKIKEFLDYFIDLGCNNFTFRELMGISKDAVNLEKIKYSLDNKVKLSDIWADMENYPEFEKYLNILGYYFYVEIYKYKCVTVSSEYADLEKQQLEFKNNPDTVYELVFHANGNLTGGWQDDKHILDGLI